MRRQFVPGRASRARALPPSGAARRDGSRGFHSSHLDDPEVKVLERERAPLAQQVLERQQSPEVRRSPAWTGLLDTRAQWLRGRRGAVTRFLCNVSQTLAQSPADARAVAHRRLARRRSRSRPPTLAQPVSPACTASLRACAASLPRVRSRSPPRAQPVSPACTASLPRVRSPSSRLRSPSPPRAQSLEACRRSVLPRRAHDPFRRPLAPPPRPPNDGTARFRRPAHATAPAWCR